MIAGNLVLKEWESKFFGRQIFSYNGPLKTLANAKFPQNSLISLKIKTEDYQWIDLASTNGFRLVEGEVVYQKSLVGYRTLNESIEIDNYIAQWTLMGELNGIVSEMYANSRFREPWFTIEERDNFYRCWLENAVLSKFDDCCLVLKQLGRICGFVTVKIRDELATIGLIGVATTFRGMGLGNALLELAIKYSVVNNANIISVSTQISNLAAANLYARAGFSATENSYWFYKQV